MPSRWSYVWSVGLALLTGAVFAFGFNLAARESTERLALNLIKQQQVATVSLPEATANLEVIKPPVTQPAAAQLRLVFVGDIMLDRGVAYSVGKNAKNNFDWLFENVPELKAADLTYGNLEGPLSDLGSDRHNLYSFRMNPAALPAIEAAGFDVLQVANNHIGDWGREAFVDTLRRLSQAGIVAVGGGLNQTENSQVKIVERQGLKIGFLAATDVGPDWLAAKSEPGIQLASDPRWPELIREAAKQVDILIVGYHFGNEYEAEPSARQRELAHQAIDQGAKLVIGTHPHVVEPREEYRGGLIAYSLGNFIFDQGFSSDTMSGLMLTVTFVGKELQNVVENRVRLDPQFRPIIGF